MNNRLIIYLLLGIAVFLLLIVPEWRILLGIGVVILLSFLFLGRRSTPSGPTTGSYRSRKTSSQKRRAGEVMPKSLPGLFSDQKLIAEISALTQSREVTKRLIESYRERFPNESEQWRREKILYDLKRDKGGI